jgi:molecular chaperone GrpE
MDDKKHMNTKKHDDNVESDEILDLKNKLELAESKLVDFENNWKRALADYKNLEKRVSEEKEAIITFANSILVLRILPILDNLKTLLIHVDDMGLKMIVKEFEKILKEEQIEEIAALGQEFDSAKMDAIEMIVSDEDNEGKVVEVLQSGYLLKNKVLRPARVKVGCSKEEK